MNDIWVGLPAVIAGAVMQASFALPQKFLRGWPWEKSWLFYSIFGMILCPWVLVAAFVPHASEVYANAGFGVTALAALFGVGWGVGSVLFGLGLEAVGLALGFAIIMSMIAALGALVPLAILHPADLMSQKGLLVVIGLAVAIAGVVLCARAGALKDAAAPAAAGKRNLGKGIAICVASGAASPMMSFALEFGKPIEKAAAAAGANAANAPMAIFAVAMSAGFLVNAGYCIFLLRRNGTWGKGLPQDRARNLLFTLAMGFLWLFGFYLYGVGKTQVGELGAICWPIFMTIMVVVANIWGLVTGEWKNADRRAFRYLAAGIIVIICSSLIIAKAG